MLKWKWAFILGVTGLALWQALPLKKKVRLGLDLKGGIHLVIQVLTDDAIKAELDEAVNRVRLGLEDKKVAFKAVDRELDIAQQVQRVVVRGLEGESVDRARKVIDSVLREYKRDMAPNGDLVAELPPARAADIRSTTVDQALNTIQERVNATGVSEPIIQRQGMRGDRILVQLPGIEDPEHVKRLIGQVAALELKIVRGGPFPTREDAISKYPGGMPPGLEVVEGSDEDANAVFYVVDRVASVTGRDLSRAQPGRDSLGQPSVHFNLNAEGARKFGDVTGKNIGQRLAIILDNRVRTAPVIKSRITDNGQIEGGFSQQEARDLSLVLRAGALPARIQYLEERTVGPFLGADSIRKGVYAGTVGLIAIILFMLVYYRLAGVNAVVALLLNGVLLLGAMAMLRAVLTLPGIAGYILTLGIAVDANVLVFEAIREYLRAGSPPKRAITDGFERVFSTIVDTHLTTMLAAGALWMLGSGPVRGFGVTLFMGLVISIFTAYYVSKTIFETFELRHEYKPGETLSI